MEEFIIFVDYFFPKKRYCHRILSTHCVKCVHIFLCSRKKWKEIEKCPKKGHNKKT